MATKNMVMDSNCINGIRTGLNSCMMHSWDMISMLNPGDDINIYEDSVDPANLRYTAKHICNKRRSIDGSVDDQVEDIMFSFCTAYDRKNITGLSSYLDGVHGAGNWGPELSVVFYWVGDLPS